VDKLTNYLVEWTELFVKHRDIVARKIVSIKKEGNRVKVEYKDKKALFLACPSLKDIDMIKSEVKEDIFVSVVTFNSEKSLKFLTDNWNEFSGNCRLSFYFINPFSKLDTKWIICPYTHAKICDPSSLKTGLKSMFEGVDAVGLKDIEKKISKQS